jgi:hypothetical protein
MRIFRILASRTEFSKIEAFVRANDADQAEELFHDALFDEGHALLMTEDRDASDIDVMEVEDVTASHAPVPRAGDPPRCVLCGRPAQWTGAPAAASPTGQTIPGAWVHQTNPFVEAGLGL